MMDWFTHNCTLILDRLHRLHRCYSCCSWQGFHQRATERKNPHLNKEESKKRNGNDCLQEMFHESLEREEEILAFIFHLYTPFLC